MGTSGVYFGSLKTFLLSVTAVTSHTRPSAIFFPFQKLSFGGRQSNVSMTIVMFISYISFTAMFDHRWIRYNRSVIMTK